MTEHSFQVLNTDDGQNLDLVVAPHENDKWMVSAFRRNRGGFIETDICFSDWLHLALTGETATDWIPEWEPLPHPLET